MGGKYDIPRVATYVTFFLATAAFAAWQTPENLGPTVNTAAGEWWPSVSEDGRYIVFVSDRAGGYGGVDICGVEPAVLALDGLGRGGN